MSSCGDFAWELKPLPVEQAPKASAIAVTVRVFVSVDIESPSFRENDQHIRRMVRTESQFRIARLGDWTASWISTVTLQVTPGAQLGVPAAFSL